jgi:hypothetical protein
MFSIRLVRKDVFAGRGLEELGDSLMKGRFVDCLRGWCIVERCKGIQRLERRYVNSGASGLLSLRWERSMKVDS